MRILLTGSTGFIGKSLIEMNLFQGHELVRSNRATDWSESFGRFDMVIHLAGKAHDKGARWDNFQRDNINLTESIVQYLKRHSPEALLVFFSTSKVYGEESYGSAFDESHDHNFETDYGKSKSLCEKIVTDSGLKFIILRPSLVMGEMPKGNLGLVRKISSFGVPLPGNINNKRSLCSTTYIYKVLSKIINSEIPSNQAYNLSEYTISTVDIFKKNGCSNFVSYPTFLYKLVPKKFAVKLFGNFEIDASKMNRFLN